MAPTAADFSTAMTDSKRDPAGPAPEGVLGVTGVLVVIVGGGARPLWFCDVVVVVAVIVAAGETSAAFVVLTEAFGVGGRDMSIGSDSVDARGSSLILNSFTPPTKSSFCRDADDGVGTFGCRAICTVRPLRK